MILKMNRFFAGMSFMRIWKGGNLHNGLYIVIILREIRNIVDFLLN